MKAPSRLISSSSSSVEELSPTPDASEQASWNMNENGKPSAALSKAAAQVESSSDAKEPEPGLTEQWWPSFWGREQKAPSQGTSDRGNNDNEVTTDGNSTVNRADPAATKPDTGKTKEGNRKEEKPAKQSKRSKSETNTKSRGIVKSKSKKQEEEAEDSKEVATEEDNVDQDEESQVTSQNNTTVSDSDVSANTTKSGTQQKSPSKMSPVASPQPSLLVLGGPAMAGGLRATSPQQQQQQQRQMRNSATTLAAAEAVGILIGNGIRLFLLMAGTRYFSNRQETIRPTQHFVFERLNDFFVRDSLALQTALDEAPPGVSSARWRRIMARRGKRGPSVFHRPHLDATFVKTVIVIEFGNNAQGELDLKYLANLVSFILTQHEAQSFGSVSQFVEQEGGTKQTILKPVDLEIVFKIDSPGGSVATFGLAAAQVERLRRVKGITTTACVDKYAASGGYMIASQAHKLVAAPFATVGSVGVIMETLNFHDLLRQYGVQPLVLKAGEAKNPLTTFGAVSKSDMEMEQERLEKVHKEFQMFTIRGRPQLKAKVKEVCNGSVYIGKEALALNLVDAIMTSDEYLMERMQAGDRVLKVHKSHLSRLAPHMRFPSFLDLLPHLKGRIECWLSQPDTAARLMQTGSLVGFVLHLLTNRMGKPPAPTS